MVESNPLARLLANPQYHPGGMTCYTARLRPVLTDTDRDLFDRLLTSPASNRDVAAALVELADTYEGDARHVVAGATQMKMRHHRSGACACHHRRAAR